MDELNMFPEISQEKIDEYVHDFSEKIKRNIFDPMFKTIPTQEFAMELFLIDKFQERTGINVSIAYALVKNDLGCNMANVGVEIDQLHEILGDIYSIEKGLKICAKEAVYPIIYDDVTNAIKYHYGLHVYKIESGKDNGYTHFYIYKHDVTQIFINAVERCTDLITREYLLGKLLGYSEESEHEYLNRIYKTQVAEANGALDDAHSYMDLVSRCSITDAQDDYVIRADCLANSGDSEEVNNCEGNE